MLLTRAAAMRTEGNRCKVGDALETEESAGGFRGERKLPLPPLWDLPPPPAASVRMKVGEGEPQSILSSWVLRALAELGGMLV